jgi:hypothetical protein
MAHRGATRNLDGVYVHNSAGTLNVRTGRKLKPTCSRILLLKQVEIPSHYCYDPLELIQDPIMLGTVMACVYGRFGVSLTEP